MSKGAVDRYRERNQDRLNAQKREYYQRNRERILQKRRDDYQRSKNGYIEEKPMLDLDEAKLEQFRLAHDTRQRAVNRLDNVLLEKAAQMYEDLGCPVNAEWTRRSLVNIQRIQYMVVDRSRR